MSKVKSQMSKLQLKSQKLKNLYHLFQALIANIYYGWPSRKIKVIGVTGTDGKTTTTHLIYHLLKTSGKKVSMISSIHAYVAGREYDTGFHITTPSSFEIQKYIKQAVDNYDEYFVLETTSHALDQNRVWGINFTVGVLTNITHEHLDYHGNYNNYLLTKAKLLLNSSTSIINSDDQSFKQLKAVLSQAGKAIITYGTNDQIDSQIFNRPSLKELTIFNKYNYLAAKTAINSLRIDDEQFIKGYDNFILPEGRLDVVYDERFKVIVDFAHTPNAITQLLKSIEENGLQGKIIHVFGSAGLRDNMKRPLMGEASSRYSDVIILTEEDYRTEDPLIICEQIEKGINKAFTKVKEIKSDQKNVYTIIIDRQAAINNAIKIAEQGDLIIITGKGHEKSLCRGKKEYPWSDKKAVLAVLSNHDQRK
jgi:UDP-N-acetylmuramoyl-L-alanyl-D-glutamate--2,6-diaminopimelate ligase